MDEIRTWMGVAGIQQAIIQTGFIRKQEQSFGIHIQATERIDSFRKSKVSQSPLAGLIRSELTEYAVRLVEGDDHGMKMAMVDRKTP